MTLPSADSRHPLAEMVVALAETPDDVQDRTAAMENVAQLAANRIDGVEYAAVIPRPDDGTCTVAVPAAPGEGIPAMAWPGFREESAGLGLGVVSVPLFAGSGTALASLDLYGRDMSALAPLTAGICAAHDPDLPWPDEDDAQPLDPGGAELIAGYAEALSVRDTIQLALAMIAHDANIDPRSVYPQFRVYAASAGVTLMEAAKRVIAAGLG